MERLREYAKGRDRRRDRGKDIEERETEEQRYTGERELERKRI